MLLTIYCDGAVLLHRQERPCFAAYVAIDGTGKLLVEWSARIPAKDVNHAELRAILEALRWAARQQAEGVKVYTDSRVAFFAVQYCGRTSRYGKIARQIRRLIAILKAVVIWVPRKLNRCADRLCRRAAKEYLQVKAG